MGPEDVIWGYREQTMIEYAFRSMKDPHTIAIRPIFLANKKCIEAHIFTCVLALFLLAIIRLKLAQRSIYLTYPEIIHPLHQLHVAKIKMKDTGEEFFKLEQVPLKAKKLVSLLHLEQQL